MAKNKTLDLSIRISGKVDKTLTAAIKQTQGLMGNLTYTMSRAGTVGIMAMTAAATGLALGLENCVDKASEYESIMAGAVKYVDGLADTQGRIGKAAVDANGKLLKASNGKTYAENYEKVYNAVLDISTAVPLVKEDLADLIAYIGQSGKTIEQMFQFDSRGHVIGGLVKDAGVMAAAWDIDAKSAADYGAKWENSFNMQHEQVMGLANAINFLGANTATTAAEIANAVNQSASLGQLSGIDPYTTAALADAMLATGVASDRVGTSIKRMALNLSKGANMTKKQKGILEEMGLTAEWVAQSLQEDSVGTLNTLFKGIAALPDYRRLDAVGQLFGVWAAEGGAKIVNNLDVYSKALDMVADKTAYMNSMQREFNILNATPEAVRTMRNSAIELFQINVGKNLVPVRKQYDEAVRQLFLTLNDNLPQIQEITGSLADLASKGINKLTKAVQKGMPYVRDALVYANKNGPELAANIGKVFAVLVGMKFAPQISGLLGGAGNLLLGTAESGKRKGGIFQGIGKLFQAGQGAIPAARARVNAVSMGARLGMQEYAAVGGNTRTGGIVGGMTALRNLGGLFSGKKKTAKEASANVFSSIFEAAGTGATLRSIIGGKIANSRIGKYAGGIMGGIRNIQAVGTMNPLQQAVTPIPQQFAQYVSSYAGAGAGLMANIWGPIAGGFGKLFAGAVPVVGVISGIIAVVSLLTDHLSGLEPIVQGLFGDKGLALFQRFEGGIKTFKQTANTLFNGGLADALSGLRTKFVGLFSGDTAIMAGKTFDGVVTVLQSVLGVVGQIVDFATGTVKPIIQDVFDFLKDTVLPTVLQMFSEAAPEIGGIVSGIGSAVMAGMQIIGSAIQKVLPIVKGIISVILKIGSVVIPAALAAFHAFADGIAAVINNVKGIFDGLINFIGGIFTGNWSRVWEGVKQIFGNAFSALVNLFKTPMNAVIALINKAVDKLNGISVTLPNWGILGEAAGKTLSINLPKIPMLATGGFTNGPSIAGEAGREAVISFLPGVRAANIRTWMEAGKLLGVSKNHAASAAGLKEIKDFDLPDGWPRTPRPGGGGGSFTFAPQITIQGNADRSVIDAALAEAESRFRVWYEQMRRQEARTAY